MMNSKVPDGYFSTYCIAQLKVNVNVHKEAFGDIYWFCTTLMKCNHKTNVFLYSFDFMMNEISNQCNYMNTYFNHVFEKQIMKIE